jgi:hypothetical protein
MALAGPAEIFCGGQKSKTILSLLERHLLNFKNRKRKIFGFKLKLEAKPW